MSSSLEGVLFSGKQDIDEDFRFVVDASKHGNVMRFLNVSVIVFLKSISPESSTISFFE